MTTDKQIKVNVTQCPYYREGKFCVYLSYKTKCEGDCNWTAYKEMEEQLKRKEQKLEKIKEILEIHKDNKCVICPKFDECFEQPSCDNVILQIIEGKENG